MGSGKGLRQESTLARGEKTVLSVFTGPSLCTKEARTVGAAGLRKEKGGDLKKEREGKEGR